MFQSAQTRNVIKIFRSSSWFTLLGSVPMKGDGAVNYISLVILITKYSIASYPPAAAVAEYCHSVGGHVAAAASAAAAGAPPMLPRVEFSAEFMLVFRFSEGARAPEGMAARWAARSSPPGPPQCTRVVPPIVMAVPEPTTDPFS